MYSEALIVDIKEDEFEFSVTDDSIFLNIMLFHDLIELLLGNVVANFIHGCNDVFFSDNSWAICIKLIENCLKHVVIQETLDIKSCNQEFSIIDFSITKIVYLTNNLFNLFIWDINVWFLNGCFQFLSINHSSTIFINFGEFAS